MSSLVFGSRSARYAGPGEMLLLVAAATMAVAGLVGWFALARWATHQMLADAGVFCGASDPRLSCLVGLGWGSPPEYVAAFVLTLPFVVVASLIVTAVIYRLRTGSWYRPARPGRVIASVVIALVAGGGAAFGLHHLFDHWLTATATSDVTQLPLLGLNDSTAGSALMAAMPIHWSVAAWSLLALTGCFVAMVAFATLWLWWLEDAPTSFVTEVTLVAEG